MLREWKDSKAFSKRQAMESEQRREENLKEELRKDQQRESEQKHEHDIRPQKEKRISPNLALKTMRKRPTVCRDLCHRT